MSGEIKHEWDGSVLTVYSDSGTSSADLQGPKGDTGPRGPQGAPGVIYDAEGELVLDLSPYATMDDVDAAIANIPKPNMGNYATKNYVSTEIAKAQMEGAGVDTSGFVTKDDLANLEVEVDHQTIITDSNGQLRTAIGGFANQGGGVDYKLSGIEYIPNGPWNWTNYMMGNIGKPWVAGCLYNISITFKDGVTIAFDIMFKESYSSNGVFQGLITDYTVPERVSRIAFSVRDSRYEGQDGDFYYTIFGVDVSELTTCPDEYIATAVTVKADDYVPIDAHYVPVDGNTIYVNDEGKLSCSISIGEDGSINLDNFYTKAEIDALIASGGLGISSSEEVEY